MDKITPKDFSCKQELRQSNNLDLNLYKIKKDIMNFTAIQNLIFESNSVLVIVKTKR